LSLKSEVETRLSRSSAGRWLATPASCAVNIRYEGRMKMPVNTDGERFQNGADKYATYLETPEGRLRSDLAFANLQDFLPSQASSSLRALDIGCGTGATAIRMARSGIHVTLLDFSPAMLNIAERAVHEAGIKEITAIRQGDATQLATLFNPGSFDVILCHNILEYVDHPDAVLRDSARLLRGSSALLSVLVRNQPGEVFKAAILSGDLTAAEACITAEWGQESLYKGKVRLFTSGSLQSTLKQQSLSALAERGVRVLSDYLPSSVSRVANYERIFELERKLGCRPEFAAVSRYIQCLARFASSSAKDGE